MSSVSSVSSTEKVPKKKRELLLLPLTAVTKITEEGGPIEPRAVGAREGFLRQVTWSFGVRHS